jgi:hypothetical protein
LVANSGTINIPDNYKWNVRGNVFEPIDITGWIVFGTDQIENAVTGFAKSLADIFVGYGCNAVMPNLFNFTGRLTAQSYMEQLT